MNGGAMQSRFQAVEPAELTSNRGSVRVAVPQGRVPAVGETGAPGAFRQLRNRVNVAADYLSRRSECKGRPVELSIELTSKCNLECVMCPRDDNARRGLGNMSLDTFSRIVDAVSGYVEFAYMHLAGEPLLHPDFNVLVDHAAERGMRIGMSTNGTILTSSKIEKILSSRLDTLIISIDGTNPETYQAIRQANSFNKVLRNTFNFLQAKKRRGKGPYTVVQMICMKENQDEADHFYNFWREQGVDAVRLKRFFNFAGNVDDHTPEGTAKQSGGEPPCYLPWRQLAFYYDGTAVACCHDFLHQSELGNIHTHSLEEIWNSETMCDLRRKHVDGRKNDIPLCAGCNQPKVSLPQVLGTAVLSAPQAKKALIGAERVARRLGIKSLY